MSHRKYIISLAYTQAYVFVSVWLKVTYACVYRTRFEDLRVVHRSGLANICISECM